MTGISQERREAIKAIHVPDSEGFCKGEEPAFVAWPCQRALLLDALEAAEKRERALQVKVNTALALLDEEWTIVDILVRELRTTLGGAA